MSQPRPLFCLFSSFSQYNDKYSRKFDNKIVNGELGIQTPDHRIVGKDEPTELMQPP